MDTIKLSEKKNLLKNHKTHGKNITPLIKSKHLRLKRPKPFQKKKNPSPGKIFFFFKKTKNNQIPLKKQKQTPPPQKKKHRKKK